ncbi:MAG: hypothetical protein IT348_10545 [Candidatus Eisenbacteria bacterium]|nr:hypothetical protein [Candidatus Eisenbacteria bacterium]
MSRACWLALFTLSSVFSLILVAGIANAEWPLGGLRIAQPAELVHTIPDEMGGAFVFWRRPGQWETYAQHLNASAGVVPAWPESGVVVPALLRAPSPYFDEWDQRSELFAASADGNGGLLVGIAQRWMDLGVRELPEKHIEYYVFRYGATGARSPGWPATGRFVLRTQVETAPYYPIQPPFVATSSDGAGGAWLMWHCGIPGDLEAMQPDYVCHVGPDSTLLVSEFASPNGAMVRPGTAVGGYSNDLYGVRTTVWCWDQLEGLRVRGVFEPIVPWEAGATPLNHGGDFLAWAQEAVGARLVHLGRDLQPAQGWPSDGLAYSSRPYLQDGFGGAFFALGVPGQRKLQRCTFDTPAITELWPGEALPDFHGTYTALDSLGGIFDGWLNGTTLYANHIQPNGQMAPRWASPGTVISPSAKAPIQMIALSPGRALICWTSAGPDTNALYVQLLADDAVVPVACSLVDTDASAERVRIEWQVSGATGAPLVQRRSGDGVWAELGDATATEYERWAFEDRDVRPGDVLDYRLLGADGALAGSQTTVHVPAAAVLALRGFLENPSRDASTIEFTLPDARPATLELFDVAGRVVARREVGLLGAGTHRITWNEGGTLEPGLWFVRLRTARQSLVTRGVQIR